MSDEKGFGIMNFSIEKKGYNVDEVNAYIDDLQAKYTALQSQNSELEQKLATAKRLIRRFSDTENALKQSIADSKRAAAYMISDAEERKEALLDSARESCGEIISDLDLQIAKRMQTISLMKAEVMAFKDAMFELYSTHIELIDELGRSAEHFEYEPDYSKVADAVDEFEDKEDPDCTVPSFVEYPEESIFAEIEEKETVSEGFMLDFQESAEPENDELSFESEDMILQNEDFSQMDLNVADAEDIRIADFELIEGANEDADVILDDAEFMALMEDSEAESDKEGAADGEPDYFKFLEDFANSEDIDA